MARVQLTARDERMLAWLESVRIADVEAVRWALSAFAGGAAPVVVRVAQRWVKRMEQAGYVGRARPAFQDSSLLWAAHGWTGKSAPSIHRQTVRHDVAVSNASARFLTAGYGWSADPATGQRNAHVADGAAWNGERFDLVEVELTPKAEGRYKQIRQRFMYRLDTEPIGRVFYLGTPSALRAVQATVVGSGLLDGDLAERFEFAPVFSERGIWAEHWTAPPAPVLSATEGGY